MNAWAVQSAYELSHTNVLVQSWYDKIFDMAGCLTSSFPYRHPETIHTNVVGFGLGWFSGGVVFCGVGAVWCVWVWRVCFVCFVVWVWFFFKPSR